MKMNTHLNIEDVAGSIVVPVWCGSERGTAFFISPTKLLTAFHVVAEYVADDSDIFISVNGINNKLAPYTRKDLIFCILAEKY